MARTLKSVENELIASNQFFRAYQSHLVNLKYLERVQTSDRRLLLSEGTEVPLARSRQAAFAARFKSKKG